jgi:spermidine synthase
MVFEKYFYPIFVFITGNAIMMLEMAAFRLATPYFGASLFVWANIIGLVMIALAIGYYFGGKIADLYPQKRILMLIVLTGGIMVSFIPLLYKFSLPYFLTWQAKSFLFESFVLSSFAFTALLFILPLTILGMVAPFVIRLQNKEVTTTGFTSGSIYAFSTLGSVFGTFFSSFLSIPFWGIKETILFSGFLLILVSLIGLGQELKKPFLLFLFLPLLLNFVSLPKRENLVYEKESFYGLIEIIKDENLGYILDINRSALWSIFNPEKILTGTLFDYFLPLYYLLDKRDKVKVLIIGHAGGTISRQYIHFFGNNNLKITGIELDPEVTKAAYKFFDLAKQKNLEIINTDGRVYLQKTKESYDLIFIDVFIAALYIPFQLSTQEFFELAKSHLKNDGVLAMNVNSQNPQDKVFQSLLNTMKFVFPYVYFFPAPNHLQYLFIGANSSLSEKFANLRERTSTNELKEIGFYISQNFKEAGEVKEKYILKDNRAPTEILREIDKFSPFLKNW